jgi:hypothetical protein
MIDALFWYTRKGNAITGISGWKYDPRERSSAVQV